MATEADLKATLASIYQMYPSLSKYNYAVGYGKQPSFEGQKMEFYPPDEQMNPRRGSPYIEIYDQSLQGEDLKRGIFGDMLHHVSSVDPAFADQRQQFQNSFTPGQNQFNQKRYQQLQSSGQETRSYDEWMNHSWLDAYIRGYLAPDAADEWRKSGTYTPEQIGILSIMKNHLSGQQK